MSVQKGDKFAQLLERMKQGQHSLIIDADGHDVGVAIALSPEGMTMSWYLGALVELQRLVERWAERQKEATHDCRRIRH